MLKALCGRLTLCAAYWPHSSRVLAVASYIGLGIVATCCTDSANWGSDEQLSFIDGLYFSIVTISTVGYGDISPVTPDLQVFTVCYIMIGCLYIFSLLASLFAGLLESYRQAVLTLVNRLDSGDMYVDTTGDGEGDAKVSGRSKGISGRGVDVSGDGQIDFYEPPHAVIFWAQELLPAVLLWLILQLVCAGVFTVTLEGLDFGTAFYHCCITAATVGYGDVPMETQASRAFASLHILVSVSWLAALFAQIDQGTAFRNAVHARVVLLTRPLQRERVVALDHDGKGVDKLEFVVGMLQILGVELCGEPLKWDDVRPFILKFEHLDASSGHLGRIKKKALEKFYDDDLNDYASRISAMGYSDRSLEIAEAHYESVMLTQAEITTRIRKETTTHRRWRPYRVRSNSRCQKDIVKYLRESSLRREASARVQPEPPAAS